MNFGIDEDLLQRISVILAAEPAVERAVLFGSRATGTYRPASDIDIALFSGSLEATQLNRLRYQLAELPTLLKFDLIDFASLKKESLRENILRDGVEISPHFDLLA